MGEPIQAVACDAEAEVVAEQSCAETTADTVEDAAALPAAVVVKLVLPDGVGTSQTMGDDAM